MPRPMIEQQRLALRRAVVLDLERDAVGRDLHRAAAAGQPAVAIASGSAGAEEPAARAGRRRTASTAPIGCARRSATAYSASGFMPMPTWLAGTSMFSASGPGSFRLQRHATMPSLRE